MKNSNTEDKVLESCNTLRRSLKTMKLKTSGVIYALNDIDVAIENGTMPKAAELSEHLVSLGNFYGETLQSLCQELVEALAEHTTSKVEPLEDEQVQTLSSNDWSDFLTELSRADKLMRRQEQYRQLLSDVISSGGDKEKCKTLVREYADLFSTSDFKKLATKLSKSKTKSV